MTNNTNGNKKTNNSFRTIKSGSSDSKLDFIKEGTDFLTEIENDDEEPEVILPEDLEDPELSEFDEEVEEDFTVEEEVSEEIKETKTGKVTVISRKVPVKKPIDSEEVEKEVNKLVNELITNVSEVEITKFLENISSHGSQLLNGEMQFLGRKNVSQEEKKEFISKLDEIISSDDVSKANSAFVLQWLKTRNNI